MIDGSTSTYASTTILGDVELCNDSTYEPTHPDNPITKVEIRAYGYCTGSICTIILRPVFSGIYDGDDHRFTPLLGSLNADWSPWFDITDDNNSHPVWTWHNIQELDCDVEMGVSVSFPPPTVYCAKVQIRVTFIN